jgi:hypothetical protein
LISLVSCTLAGQEKKVISDFRFDGSIGVTKEFFDVLEVGFESIIKLEKDASIIDEIDFDLDLKYTPYKFIRLGVGYRIAANHKKDGKYVSNQRVSGDMEFGVKLQRFKIEYRIRYQNIDDDFFLYDQESPPQHIIRNKLELKYNIKNCKLSPFLYYELYGKINSNDKFAFRHKYAFGARYSFGKYGKIKAFYRIIQELNNPNPYIIYNLRLGYVYDF